MGRTFESVVLLFLLSLWLVLSILYQIQRPAFVRWLTARDYFVLLPAWNFFSPEPGRHDYVLLYRDRFADGTVTPWHEIMVEGPGAAKALWNPSKRGRKAVSDMCSVLAQVAPRIQEGRLLL